MNDFAPNDPGVNEPQVGRGGPQGRIGETDDRRTGRVSPMAGKKKPPIVLRETYLLGLLDSCTDDLAGRRVAAAIALLWRTGVTVAEVLNLRVSHIDLSRGAESIEVVDSYLADRRLALDPLATHYAKRWMKARQTLPGDHFLSLLTGPTVGKNWDGTDLRATLKRQADLAAASTGQRPQRPPTPNDFRVTLAAELMIEQWPLPHIQAQMGLDSIGTFKVLLPHLGIRPAEEEEVIEIARARPQPGV